LASGWLLAPDSAMRLTNPSLILGLAPLAVVAELGCSSSAFLVAPDGGSGSASGSIDSGSGSGSSGEGSGGGYAPADFVRAQILRRWWPDLTTDSARGIPVALTLKMNRQGEISDVRITDQQRFNTDKLFRGMALSARNAAMLASPIPLPPGRYDAVMNISITLDPKAVLH